MSWLSNIAEKLNPVQPIVYKNEGQAVPTSQTRPISVNNAYKHVEVVSRAVNLIVDLFAMVDYDVKDTLPFTGLTDLRQKSIYKILNYKPNPYQDANSFRRDLCLDFLLQGDAFIYFDGANFYHWKASAVEIVPDPVTRVAGYKYDGGAKIYPPENVLHIRDNGVDTKYRGWSRINAALDSLGVREDMVTYQKQFFKEGISPGLIFTTPQALGHGLKERMRDQWAREYSNKRPGRPMILDAGLEAKSLGQDDFSKLEFSGTVTEKERLALVALGVPPILLDSGNNANLRPNIDLLFNLTIIPMVRKFIAVYEGFFAFDIKELTYEIPALAPDAKAQSDRLTALVNNGVMTGQEARSELRLEKIEDPLLDKIRIPANVAGSATDVTGQEGGRPEGSSGDSTND